MCSSRDTVDGNPSVAIHLVHEHQVNVVTEIVLIVKGLIKQKVMYVAKLPEQSVHAAHFEKPFCTFLELPEFYENDNGKRDRLTSEQIGLTQVLIEDCIVQAHDSRTIDKCVVLFIWTTLQ